MTKTLVQEMWDMLDETMVHIMENRDATDAFKREEKARARAQAECIAIFMRPFFDTADDIAKEAVRRYRAKQAGDTEYETAGLGTRRYETAALAHASKADGWYTTPEDGYTSNPEKAGAVSQRRTNRGAAAPAPIKIRLSEQDQTSIKKAHTAMPQIFTVAVLAKQYGATEAEVSAILKA